MKQTTRRHLINDKSVRWMDGFYMKFPLSFFIKNIRIQSILNWYFAAAVAIATNYFFFFTYVMTVTRNTYWYIITLSNDKIHRNMIASIARRSAPSSHDSNLNYGAQSLIIV